MLAHDIRSRSWCYGSWDWTVLPIFHYVLLPCNRWQQRGSLIKWHLTWSAYETKVCHWNSSVWKKWHPLTYTDSCWPLMETKQSLLAQWGSGWCASASVTVTVCHLCWSWFLQVQNAGFCSSLVKMHSYWWWLHGKVFCSWEFALSTSIIVLFVSAVVSMEINRRRYFWSDLHNVLRLVHINKSIPF